MDRQGRVGWTRVRGVRIFARTWEGPDLDARSIVLVHGLGVSSRYMIPLGQQLSKWYRVTAVDLPGFGRSDKPRGNYSVAQLADWLGAWMRAVGLRDVVLLGNSLGCQIIAHLAVASPGLVSSTVLVGPTIDRQYRTASAQLTRIVLDGFLEPPSLVWIVALDYTICGVRRLWKTFRQALRDRIEEKLTQMHVPTLVVRGAWDVLVPQAWAKEVTALLPHARLAVMPGVAHGANYSAPGRLARLVRDFMENQSQTTGKQRRHTRRAS